MVRKQDHTKDTLHDHAPVDLSPLLGLPVHANLPAPASGRVLAGMLDQFSLTVEDVEELERLMNGPFDHGLDQ